MSDDKLSNEEYFKAHTELYLLTKDIRSDEERKEIAAHMWNLHNEVKDRIDQTEELPFKKVYTEKDMDNAYDKGFIDAKK